MTDPDEFARQYMTAEPQPNIQLVSPPTINAVPVVNTPVVNAGVNAVVNAGVNAVVNAGVNAGVNAVVDTPNITPTDDATIQPPTKPFLSDQMLKDILYSPVFRVTIVFLLVFIMLIAIKPSFVEHRTKDQNPLESAPISYRKVIIFTGLVILLVVVIPIVWENQLKIVEVFNRVRQMAT